MIICRLLTWQTFSWSATVRCSHFQNGYLNHHKVVHETIQRAFILYDGACCWKFGNNIKRISAEVHSVGNRSLLLINSRLYTGIIYLTCHWLVGVDKFFLCSIPFSNSENQWKMDFHGIIYLVFHRGRLPWIPRLPRYRFWFEYGVPQTVQYILLSCPNILKLFKCLGYKKPHSFHQNKFGNLTF